MPGTYIRTLYDRIDELKALVSAHQSSSSSGSAFSHHGTTATATATTTATATDPTTNVDAFRCIIPSKTGYLFLKSSPPVIIGNATIRKLLNHNTTIDSPSLVPSHQRQAQEGLPLHAASKFDRGAITPTTVRLLLAHYTRCIEPVYSTGMTLAHHLDASLKQMDEEDRCRVLLACAIAAIHKSHHAPSWKIVATTCREWAGELAADLVLRRDDQTIAILLLLIIYELADSERGLIRELLAFAARMCLELGWHRADEHSDDAPVMTLSLDRRQMTLETKRRILHVLIDIERPMSILTHRPSMLSSSIPSDQSDSDSAYDYVQQLTQELFGYEATITRSTPVQCLLTEQYSRALAILQRMPTSEVMTHEAWLLLHPALTSHTPCRSCCSFPTVARLTEFSGLHTRVLSEATCLIDSVYTMLSSQDVFIPPIMAGTRAFMAGCVLVTGLASKWPGAEKHMGSLLKCSEVLAFTAPLWKGGRDYYDVYRQIAKSV